MPLGGSMRSNSRTGLEATAWWSTACCMTPVTIARMVRRVFAAYRIFSVVEPSSCSTVRRAFSPGQGFRQVFDRLNLPGE